jgi:glycosyltransferase involved in cell wall biosynthesis
LSNSEFGRNQIKQLYGCNARIITHGLNPFQQGKRRAEIRHSLQISENDVAVLTVNYLHPRKRIELFIETLSKAKQSNPSLKGIIVGDGPDRTRLETQADSSIRFTGFVPEAALHEYFQAADLYLHTARLETFGLSVIEASANYLPVVTVNEGGPLETVIDGETGFLREAFATELGEAILTLAENSDQRKRFGKKGFEYARGKYDWEKGAEDFLSAYCELL